ncbi:class I SAM-dependent methyltransferase [Cyanobium sp. FGCU-6]|nr:class I SAM-dependent methyltransferase [Cyanobium sp. FGCU6]
MTWKERETLYRLAKTAKQIAEIGSYVGASASCFGMATKDFGAKRIICIDTWNNDAMTEGNRDTWKEFCENTEDFRQFITPVRGFSTLVLEQIRSITSELDLLLIDGDHSYEGVKADWEAYKALLREGSTVVFHDIGWAEGVKRVVQEDVEPFVRESGRLPNMWWGVLAHNP